MNSFIEPLNVWGAHFIDFAPPMLWQSTLLMALVFGFDFLLRRKIRPGVRYALWFVVFVKLLLPPTLALPTGAAWWLRSRPAIVPPPHTSTVRVSYGSAAETVAPPEVARTFIPPPGPKLSNAAWAMLASVLISAFLFAWSVFRWRRIAQCVRRTTSPPDTVSQLLAEVRHTAGLRGQIRLRLTSDAISPAVCGLFRPTVLLPQALIANLSPEQIRAVLLHELIHLRRHDVWVNCAQTLLQIFYWWHPLLWFANARVRRLREEAVDDAVMCALNEEAEIYAPTLLEVAKLAFHRPLSSLGLVGILESRNALRQRIERLLNFATPRRAGLSVMSIIGIAAFSALAVPMGEPPARPIQSGELSDSEPLIMFHAKVNPEIFLRNLKARASGTMHTPADDPRDVLLSILESFGVDSTPPRSITLNPQAGEITAQNTSEALGILDEVVKELNLPGGEHILNPPHNLKQVLIEAQFYEIRPEDAGKLRLTSRSFHRGGDLTPWWELSPTDLTQAQQHLKELGVQPLSSPRIQTSHGVMASLFVGDGTNNIQLECLPFIRDGLVNLTALARTSGKYAPGGKAWPDVAGHTNCAIFSRISIHDGDGAGFVAKHAGTTAENQLLVLLKAKILEPAPPAKPSATGTEPSAASSSVSNSDTDAKTLLADCKLLLQLGKLDESEAKLQKVLAIHPNDRAALYYLNLIKQTRARQSVGERNTGSGALPLANAPTNTVHTNAARQKIYQKLNEITFDKISFSDMTLGEAVGKLVKETKTRDPNHEGLNFILNKTRSQMNPAAQGDQPDIDLSSVKIDLEELTNVSLLDVLEAITKSASSPIKYSLLDYGIEFSLHGPEVLELHTRTFKLNVNPFVQALISAGAFTDGMNSSNSWDIQRATVNGFRGVGVDLQPPKSVFFNDRRGTLTVRATEDDLTLIEQAINTLNIAPAEVVVKAKFIVIDDNAVLKPGFEWYSKLAASGNSNGVWTGIITDPQFSALQKKLKQRDAADLLQEFETTTLSGRQAQIQLDTDPVVPLSSSFALNTNSSLTLDIVPYVSPDGYTIQLTLIPTQTEFVEYAKPGNFVPSANTNGQIPIQGPLPLPQTRGRQIVTSATVEDGHTVVLGGFYNFGPAQKKNLFVLVTPTIIDASGNRVHQDDLY
jgi:beta-lactamase regulating signal transducer with metallopeptidase domain